MQIYLSLFYHLRLRSRVFFPPLATVAHEMKRNETKRQLVPQCLRTHVIYVLRTLLVPLPFQICTESTLKMIKNTPQFLSKATALFASKLLRPR